MMRAIVKMVNHKHMYVLIAFVSIIPHEIEVGLGNTVKMNWLFDKWLSINHWL